MPNLIIVKNRIKNFNKKITVSGDKSISIRWVLFSSIASGISKAKNLLMSEDVFASINVIKKLGIKVTFNKNICKIYGKGIEGLKYKKAIDFSGVNLNGDSISLSDFKGKIIVVDFWATWCVPCKEEFPTYKKLEEKYKNLPKIYKNTRKIYKIMHF